jgi:thiol-disulfide isomerase/thioredoxin
MNSIPKFLFIISLISLFSCQSKENQTTLKISKCIIEGKIELVDGASKVISLLTNDLILESRYVQTIDSNGYFRFEFDMLYPHEVYLEYEKGRVVIFAKHQDSLFININSKNFNKEQYPEYEISGKGAELSKEIKLYKRFRKLKNFKPKCKDKTPTEFFADLNKHLSRENSVINAFSRLHNPSKDFQEWAKKYQTYVNAGYLVDFEFHHFMNKTKYDGNIFDNMIFPINDDEALISSNYDYHLRHYAIYTHLQKNNDVQTLIKDGEYNKAYDMLLRNIKIEQEDGLSREIMSYLMIVGTYKEQPKTFLKLVDSCSNYLNDPVLIKLLKEKKENLTNQNQIKISLLDNDKEKEKEINGDFLIELAKKHKGKVIYLDVWASWCGPCRGEMSYAIELHKHYKGKDISFVNLCLSSDKTDWKKTIKNLNIGGENYFFDKDQSLLIKSKLKVSGFPTYLIIDQEGNIVDNKAPRPSTDQKIKDRLNEVLNRSASL